MNVTLFLLSVTLLSIQLVHSFTSVALVSRRDFAFHQKAKKNADDEEPLPIRRALIGSSLLATTQLLFSSFFAPAGFERIPTQFVAALGNPEASSGTGANEWGIWSEDPGPQGVLLKDYDSLVGKYNGHAPAGWDFNKNDWWLEEHGIIMPSPYFPVAPGRYLVTGGRLVTTPLTIREDGSWSLKEGKLYDITHLPCRSARYHPNAGNGSPATANGADFPVIPGAEMPKVVGCDKQDYAVLFIIGKEANAEV